MHEDLLPVTLHRTLIQACSDLADLGPAAVDVLHAASAAELSPHLLGDVARRRAPRTSSNLLLRSGARLAGYRRTGIGASGRISQLRQLHDLMND